MAAHSDPEQSRPRLHIFGESLGAQTSEDIFADEGTEGLHRVGIDRGLFLGTPAATKFRQRWLSEPRAVDHDGEIVEEGDVRQIFDAPREAYTRALLAASLEADPDARRREVA